MAWYKRYQVPFQSFNGTQYMVYICEQTSGSVVTLTGAAEPFVTQEDSDDDIFIPIRTQTGYLRVVDETADGNLLEQLIPSNNMQKLVWLYSGTWDTGFTTFTDGDLLWSGFMCSQAFTQKWDKQKKVIELPVVSLLGALQYVQIPEDLASAEERFAKLIIRAASSLNLVAYNVVIISNLNNVQSDMLHVLLQYSTFFSEKTVSNQGESYNQIYGDSYYDALSAVCRLYGCCMRQNGANLYIVMYDVPVGELRVSTFTWSQLQNIANGMMITDEPTALPSQGMLESITFNGSDNAAGFLQGAKLAEVSLNLGGLTFGIELPLTEETADTPIEFLLHWGKLIVQPHQPRNLYETFTFYDYIRDSLYGTSDYQTMLQNTIINGYYNDPYATTNVHLYTGAFPCRWFRQNNTEQIVLKNGLYMNTQYRRSVNDGINPTPNLMYKIQSKLGLHASAGWIRINFNLHSITYQQTGSTTIYLFDDTKRYYLEDLHTEIRVCLKIGNKYWNGSQWVSGSGVGAPGTYFTIFMTNNTINTNKTSDMNIVDDDGFFVPITEKVDDFVEFYILNYMTLHVTIDGATQYQYCYSHILDELIISHCLPIPYVASQRASNKYVETILASGFENEANIDLSVGTINNNPPNACFIKRNASTYIELLTYKMDGSITAQQRPELNLLARMVAHYNQVRRTFRGILASGLDLMLARYTYLGRKFFGVDAQHNWRDDTQEVKFIEVT